MSALILKNLTKRYHQGPLALNGINLEVPKGGFFGLLGPNGAGKSTTIGIITSLVKKTSGTVSIFGYDLDTHPNQARAQLGLVPQEFNFNVFEKVIDILVNQAGFYGFSRKQSIERAEFYLKKLGLWNKRNDQARALSGGMKRRLMIARGLVHEPKLLILDEPTAGVDIELRRSTWAFLKEMNESGITIILTTHYLEEAEMLCNEVAIIDKGQIIANTKVKDLIKKLNKETVVLDLQSPLDIYPDIEGFQIVRKDDLSIEVSFTKQKPLNELFNELTQSGISVLSMRNKTNRLEELFLDMVSANE